MLASSQTNKKTLAMSTMNAPISSPVQGSSTAASSATISPFALPPATAATATTAPNLSALNQLPAEPKGNTADVFLRDFSLVAEAAKRAQVAVLVRDLEDCVL